MLNFKKYINYGLFTEQFLKDPGGILFRFIFKYFIDIYFLFISGFLQGNQKECRNHNI